MNDRDRTDLWTSLAIGAVVGIGAALLLRSSDETETEKLLRRLKPVQKGAKKAVRNAGRQLSRRAGSLRDDLMEEGGDALKELRKDAAKIVAQARRELEDMAESGLKQARQTAKRARRRFV